jgi:hypothetical protein
MVFGTWTIWTRRAFLRQVPLVLVEQVGRLQRVVAADGDQRVDLEVHQGAVDVAQAHGLLRVVEIRGVSTLARVGAGRADHDAAVLRMPVRSFSVNTR